MKKLRHNSILCQKYKNMPVPSFHIMTAIVILRKFCAVLPTSSLLWGVIKSHRLEQFDASLYDKMLCHLKWNIREHGVLKLIVFQLDNILHWTCLIFLIGWVNILSFLLFVSLWNFLAYFKCLFNIILGCHILMYYTEQWTGGRGRMLINAPRNR